MRVRVPQRRPPRGRRVSRWNVATAVTCVRLALVPVVYKKVKGGKAA